MSLDPLTGTCPTCGALVGQECHTASGEPCAPHARRLGVVRDGIHEEVRRYARLVSEEVGKLGSGAIHRDDLTQAVERALERYDYDESAA